MISFQIQLPAQAPWTKTNVAAVSLWAAAMAGLPATSAATPPPPRRTTARRDRGGANLGAIIVDSFSVAGATYPDRLGHRVRPDSGIIMGQKEAPHSRTTYAFREMRSGCGGKYLVRRRSQARPWRAASADASRRE